MSENNYFLKYHELVVHRIFNKETGLYPHQREALLAMYRKAQRGELSPTGLTQLSHAIALQGNSDQEP